ncbi:hypothetical protein Tco_0717695 [Tanacetum coccineum]
MEDDMVRSDSQLIDILCNLEQIYPPAFFDIMIHLVIHLREEALEGGHISYPWMYPFERYMKTLKNYVRNKAKPEGSIAKGYVAQEELTFCSHYFRGVTTKFNHPDRNVDCPPSTCQLQVFRSICRSIGKQSFIQLDHQEMKKVIWYALHNSPEIDTYLAEFERKFPNKGDRDVIHDNNSSNLILSASLNDLDLSTLNINGQSTKVDAPPYIINVDDDDDFIDDEDDVPHDLANSDDEVLANADDDQVATVVYSMWEAEKPPGEAREAEEMEEGRVYARKQGTSCSRNSWMKMDGVRSRLRRLLDINVDRIGIEPCSEESSSRIVIPTNVHLVNQPQEHIEKWTKDNLLDKIIGDPSRPVSTRLQLQTEAMFCYYDALLSSMEHKSYKDALTESCWFNAMKSSMSSNIWRFGS